LNRAEEAIEAATKARELSSSLSDYRGEAQSFLTIGLAFQSLRLYRQACESIEDALDLYNLAGDASEKAIALTHHGIVLTYLSHYTEALECLDRAENLLRGIEDPRARAIVFVQRGIVLRLLGKPRTAESLILTGVKMFKQVGDRVGEARALIQLAVTQVAIGHFRMAVWNGRRSIRLARQARDIRAQIVILAGLGDEVYRSIGDFSRAENCIKESMRLIEESGQKENLAMYQDSMAGILLSECRVEEALLWSKLSLMSCKSGEVGTGQLAEVQYRLGCIYSEMGNWFEAAEYLRQALRKHIRFREIPYQIRTIVALSRVYFRRGSYPVALRYSRRALKLLRECEDREQVPLIYWNHHQLLKAAYGSPASDKFLRQAYELLMQQVELFKGRMKLHFATGIRINREILKAAKRLNGAEVSSFPSIMGIYAQAGPESTLM
jgi:tetratricopeptide (TPR) repeat protein